MISSCLILRYLKGFLNISHSQLFLFILSSFYCHESKCFLLFFSPSFQDPSFSLLLHDKLQVPNSSRRAWNERDSRCDVCATHLTQLKQEAVRMVLTLDQWDLSPASSPPALSGRYGSQAPPGPSSGAPGGPLSREWPPFLPSSSSPSAAAAAASQPAHTSSQSPSPVPSQTPTPSPSHGSCSPQSQGAGHRLGSKPSSLGLGGGVDRRNGSPSSGKTSGGQQQPVTGVNSPGNNGSSSSNNGTGAVLSTAALQAHQHLNRTNGGVTLYPYQVKHLRCVYFGGGNVCVCACVYLGLSGPILPTSALQISPWKHQNYIIIWSNDDRQDG